MKTLKLWNGRPYGVLPTDQWKGKHIYVAAYSVEDVRRLCGELGLNVPSRNEITVYWSKCWGNSMIEIPIERGVWIGDEITRETPKQVTSNATQAPQS